MATVTYALSTLTNTQLNTGALATGVQKTPALSSLPDGGWFAAWDSDGTTINGAIRNLDGSNRVTFTSPLNTTTAGLQANPELAQLSNGDTILVFTDTSAGLSTIRAREFTGANGTAAGNDFEVSLNP